MTTRAETNAADITGRSEADEQKERLVALLLTEPGWNRNYTATQRAAEWLIEEADRVGWSLTIKEA